MLIQKIKTLLSKKGNDRKALLAKSIIELDTTVRTYNILRRAGIVTVGDLVQLSWADLASVRRMNRRGIEEIEGLLSDIGLGLKEDGK